MANVANAASASRAQRELRTTRTGARVGNVAYTVTPRVVLCVPDVSLPDADAEEHVTHRSGPSMLPYDTRVMS